MTLSTSDVGKVELKPLPIRDNDWALVAKGTEPGQPRFLTSTGELSVDCVGEEVLRVIAATIDAAARQLRNLVIESDELQKRFWVNTLNLT